MTLNQLRKANIIDMAKQGLTSPKLAKTQLAFIDFSTFVGNIKNLAVNFAQKVIRRGT